MRHQSRPGLRVVPLNEYLRDTGYDTRIIEETLATLERDYQDSLASSAPPPSDTPTVPLKLDFGRHRTLHLESLNTRDDRVSDHVTLIPAIKGDVEKALSAGCSSDAILAIAGIDKIVHPVYIENSAQRNMNNNSGYGTVDIAEESPQPVIIDDFEKIIQEFQLPRGSAS